MPPRQHHPFMTAEQPNSKPSSRWGRRLLRFLAFTASLVLLALLFGRFLLDDWLRETLERELAARLDASVRIGSVRARLVGLEVQIEDVQILAQRADGGRMEVRLPEGRVRLALTGLRGLPRRRIHLADVELKQPLFDANRAFLDGLERGKSIRPFSIRIDRAHVERGVWMHADRPVELTIGGKGISVDAGWDAAARALRGDFALSFEVDRAPLRALALQIESDFAWTADGLETDATNVHAEGLELQSDLRIAWGEGFHVEGQGETRIDFDAFSRYLPPPFPVVGGQIEGPVRFSAGPEPLRVESELVGVDPRFGRIVGDGVRSSVVFTPGRLELNEMDVNAFDGRIRGTTLVQLTRPPQIELDLRGHGLRSSALLDWLGVPLELAARVDASFSLQGPAATPEDWIAHGSFVASKLDGGDKRVPVEGRGQFDLKAGRLDLIAGGVRAAGATLQVNLRKTMRHPGASDELRIVGQTGDAAATQAGALKICRGFGLAIPEIAQRVLQGRGAVSTTLSLAGERQLEIGGTLVDGAWGSQPFDSLDVRTRFDETTTYIDRLTVERGEANLELTMAWPFASAAPSRIDGRMNRMDVDPLLEIAGIEFRPGGQVDAELRVEHGVNGYSGSGNVQVRDAQLFGESIEKADALVVVVQDRVRFDELTLNGEAFHASAGLAWDPASGSFYASAVDGAIDLERLNLFRERELPLSGSLRFEGSAGVEAGLPQGQLRVNVSELELHGVALGAIAGELNLAESGTSVGLHPLQRDDWTMDAEIGWSTELPITAEMAFRAMEVDLLPEHEPPVWVRLDGGLSIRGPLASPIDLVVEGELEQALLHLGARQQTTTEPLPIRLAGRELKLGPVALSGDGVNSRAEFVYSLESGMMDARVKGHFDLGLVSAFSPQLRGAGQVTTDLAAFGPIGAPQFRGALKVEEGRLRLLGQRETLEQIDARFTLVGRELLVERIQASFGGGELRAEGRFQFGRDSLESHRLKIDAGQVSLEGPSGFNGVYDARLLLEGTSTASILSGDVELLQGVYDEPFEVGALLLPRTREYSSDELAEFIAGLQLNIDLNADGNVWVRNELAELESRLALNFGGTVDQPILTGRASILEGGKVTYRDVEYRILSGGLDFVELDRINPLVNLRAETTVGAYEILLRLEGQLDRLEYELTSTPSLSPQDIIVLLTTGRTLEGLTRYDSGAEFTGDLAANYFAGALTDRFGKQLQKLLKLDRLRIDPLLIEGEADPTTRITVGQEVAKDVLVVLSTDIGSTERQLYQVEWQATPKLRVTVQDETDSGIGADLSYFRRFWTRRPPRLPASSAETAGTPAAGTVVQEIAFTGEEIDADSLRRLLPLEVGGPFLRSGLFAGTTSLRRHFVDQGRLQARVTARAEDGADGVIVRYDVDPGPVIVAEIEGVSKKGRRRIRKALRELWAGSLYNQSFHEDSAEVIREDFRARGYYTVEVGYREEQIDGQRVVRFLVDDGKAVRVRAVKIVGAVQLPESRIRRQMLTQRRSIFSRRLLIPETLAQDVAAIRNLYRDQGFLHVRVAEPKIQLASNGASAVVELTLDEGPRFIVSELSFPELADYSPALLQAHSELTPGAVFSRSRMLTAESNLRAALDRDGYPDARIHARSTIGDTRVAVAFEIELGSRKRVGNIVFAGNHLTRSRIIRRQLSLQPGELISHGKILTSQHQLYKLGIFRNVTISYRPMPGADDPELQELEVRVEEAKPLGMRFGLGYDSEGGGRFNFSITDENVGGRNRLVGFQGQVSSILKRAQIVAKEPLLFGHRVPGLLNLSWEDREEVGFSVIRRAAALRIDRELGPRWSLYGRYGFQRVDLRDVIDPSAVFEQKLENLSLGDVGVLFARDTRDDPLRTTRGTYLALSQVVYTNVLASDADFTKTRVAGSYHTSFNNGISLAASVRLGLSVPFGSTTAVPLSERFFAGGDSTLRGFPRDEAGPKGEKGQPIGGELLVLINEEFGFPLWKQLRGVLFYDLGNVFAEPRDFAVSELRNVLGLGIRFESPIGPLRIEYGRKLDREPGESRGELFFSIGAAF